jgi:hypothetical protein
MSDQEAAHVYLDAGLMPHPWRVKEGTKASAYRGFSFSDIQETDESIERWRPGWRCGLVVSPASGLIAIDVDEPGIFEAWECGWEWPVTARSITGRAGGGYHLLLDGSGLGEDEWPKQGNIPGGQVKSNGFIAVEPSLHPSGRPYRWGRVRKVAPAGDAGRMLARWRSSQNGHGGVRDRAQVIQAAGSAVPGTQHDALRDYAQDLAMIGLAEEEALLLLGNQARKLKLEGRSWREADLLGLFRSAASRTVGNARGAEARLLEELMTWEPGEEDEPPARKHKTAIAAVPDYPVTDGVLGRLIKSAGHLPPAIVGGAGLAALSAACSGWSLEMPDTSSQYPVLWVPLIAPRGAGKTPAMDLAFECLRNLDAGTLEDYRKAMVERNKMSKEDRALQEKPRDLTLLIDDFTLEALARKLNNGEERSTVVVDEMSGFLRGMGRYNRSGGASEMSRLLSLWSSVPWRYDRVTDDLIIYIRRPVVSITGGIQPHLHGLLGDDDSGMRPRWLPHYVPAWKAKWGKHRAPASWNRRIAELYCGPGQMLVLEGEALEAWEKAGEKWRARSDAPGISDTVHGALAKADVTCARIALVLGAAGKDEGTLSAKWVHEATRLVDYCLGVWAALPSPEEFGMSDAERDMRRKVAKLREVAERHGRISRNEIIQGKVAGVASASDCTRLLKAYGQMYPGCVRKEKTGGRPAEVAFPPERVK